MNIIKQTWKKLFGKRNIEKGKIFVVFPSFTYWWLDGEPVSSRTALDVMDRGIKFNGPRLQLRPTDLALHPEKYC